MAKLSLKMTVVKLFIYAGISVTVKSPTFPTGSKTQWVYISMTIAELKDLFGELTL